MEQVSVFRLRLGLVLIGIWWIPIWLLAPLVAHLVDGPVGSVTIAIAIAQTVIGLIGVLIAGRQAAKIVRHTGFRAVPGKIWHVLWKGRLIEPEPGEAPGASEPSAHT
ncbi:MAG: hypothetical protein WAL31_08795 [Gaiellaceae bacterium]